VDIDGISYRGSVISYGSPQKLFYNYRNSLILLFKNLPTSTLLWLLPWRLLLDIVSAVRLLFQFNLKEIAAIIRAHWHFFGLIPSLLSKRKKTQALVSKPNYKGIYRGSIVIDYFAKKKQYFSQLDSKLF
jgi:hypothetical protein